ncbi:MAG: DEAD/DEAH box helicase, partial [Terriglobia bacterium]
MENKIIVVQGPPGTGKSLTIANVACHLVAQGRRVLITSQKDKALDVVDELLRGLGFSQLPMTLLRQDRDSKLELRERLESIQKTRAAEETQRERDREAAEYTKHVVEAETKEQKLVDAVLAEHLVAEADGQLSDAVSFFQRLKAHWQFRRAIRLAKRRAPQRSDELGRETARKRAQLLAASLRVLSTAAEHRVGEASRNERNQLRELSKLLGRNQANFKNFSVFDRMKGEPERCHMLLKILPCWIMTPDDVARLFPCEPGLFDTVIIDEASQCDLPSMTPVLYRAKQAIIAGDSKQMQAQRFAFTSNQVAAQAWREQGLDRFDPDRWLDPAKIDLLQLASIRMDEEAFLDEHYRSLPPIIDFSNQRWYGGRLRLMRDADDRRFGDPDVPTIALHHITDGRVEPGTQENEREATELVKALKDQLQHPG